MAVTLSLNEVRTRAAGFVRAWTDSPGAERQDAHGFVMELLAVYGVTAVRAAYYEKRVKRAATGTQGYIDALIPGVALIEMKSAGKDLAAAERQALDYVAGLSQAESPRYVLTSDFRRFRLLDLLDVDGQPVEWELADFPANADRLDFFAGYQATPATRAEQEAASVKAARLMASLYESLESEGLAEHDASVFLVRTLFCLYADDAGVWTRDLFFSYVHDRTSEDGTDLGMRLAMLYQALAKPLDKRQGREDEYVSRFPYVNGELFAEQVEIPAFDATGRERLLECCLFNWSAISPAVFGSLFQAVKSKEARRTLGEHYTTERNILRLIGPMFLDDLRARFERDRNEAPKLRGLLRELSDMRFLDPACGCGNFLVVAYRELRALNLDVLVRLQELQTTSSGGRTTSSSYFPSLMFDVSDLAVRVDSFHGIEIEEWPARIAATALHLADHQANQAMFDALGMGPETLPLTKIDTIHVANALRTDWPEILEPTDDLFVMGNPPFLGHATRDEEQARELRDVWKREDIGRLDYVTGWYAKVLDLFTHTGYSGEFAFVSTSSITQGEPVPALFGPVFRAGWRIKFAHRTFAWTSEAPGAAAVHCVILGFDRRQRLTARIFDYENLRGEATTASDVRTVNGYLAEGPNVLVEQRREPLASDLPSLTMGNMARDSGNLIVEPEDYDTAMGDPVAAKYVRRFVGSRELIHAEKRWCLWLTDLDPAEIRRSPVLRQRLEAVRKFRSDSRASSTRQMADTPHLFGQRSHIDVPHLVVPKVSSETRRFVPCAHFGPETIASDLVFVAEDPHGLAFAVASSSSLRTWLGTVGGRLESRLRLTNTIVWNTFPLPTLADAQREAIIAGGQAVLDARSLHPERSLADHYNPLAMAPELLKAHAALDRAVDAALGLKGTVTDDQRRSRLFALYEELTAADQLALPKPKRGRR